MAIKRLENIGIVVEDLPATIEFFTALGLTLNGEGSVEGEWVDRVVNLEGVKCDIAMLDTPDGQGQLEVMSFRSPDVRVGDQHAPPNTLGLRRLLFSVDDLDATVAGLQERGTKLMGDVVNYEGIYRLCYIHGPEGIIVMLAEKLSDGS